jgi:hypothetical protein
LFFFQGNINMCRLISSVEIALHSASSFAKPFCFSSGEARLPYFPEQERQAYQQSHAMRCLPNTGAQLAGKMVTRARIEPVASRLLQQAVDFLRQSIG